MCQAAGEPVSIPLNLFAPSAWKLWITILLTASFHLGVFFIHLVISQKIQLNMRADKYTNSSATGVGGGGFPRSTPRSQTACVPSCW